MTMPRSHYVQENTKRVYHCFSRCVRRAFLCGFDLFTKSDYSHRKHWLVNRLKFQANIFAIEVIAYAVMANHYHVIIRTRPDIAANWPDYEVAERWLLLFSDKKKNIPNDQVHLEEKIKILGNCPEHIAKLRKRLSSVSWFIGRLNEFVARAANKEDDVKGRFWESRFKCQALLDQSAITACMVYVDLNPIRAGIAQIPEESDFTSIQERIREWQKDRSMRTFSSWLCSIQSDIADTGILNISTMEYFELVDRSGRMIRPDKSGLIAHDVKPILQRIKAIPEAWIETVASFGSKFCVAAGLASNIRNFAGQVGRRWLKGVASAQAAFE